DCEVPVESSQAGPVGRGIYRVYIHSLAAGTEAKAQGTKWRQPNTSLKLARKGQPGDTPAKSAWVTAARSARRQRSLQTTQSSAGSASAATGGKAPRALRLSRRTACGGASTPCSERASRTNFTWCWIWTASPSRSQSCSKKISQK